MKNTNPKNHFRHHSFTAKNEHRKAHAQQHHEYLLALQNHRLLFPRYDISSEKNHNNLIIHVKHSSKDDLRPKKPSFFVSKLQQKIQCSEKNVQKPRQTQKSFFTRNDSQRTQELNHQAKSIQSKEKEVGGLIIYEQKQDSALSMEEKLRIMYLGSRYQKNTAKATFRNHSLYG